MKTRSTTLAVLGSAALLIVGGAVFGLFEKPDEVATVSTRTNSDVDSPRSSDDLKPSVASDVLDPYGTSEGAAKGLEEAAIEGTDIETDQVSLADTEPRLAIHSPTDQEAIETYGSVTSWQLHLLEAEDQEAFPEWIDEQFEAGLEDVDKSFENVQMISEFLAEASAQGYTGQPIVECSAMICRLEFTGATDMRALTRMIGQDLVALPDDVAGFHGMRRGPNNELVIFAPLKGILGRDL